jgi:hypothetical protein
MLTLRLVLCALPAFASIPVTVAAQDPGARPRPEDTEVWQPVPPVVSPPPLLPAFDPPSGAIVLVDGTNLDEWVNARDRSFAERAEVQTVVRSRE